MNLFERALSDESFDDVFSDAALVGAMLRFEAQLALSQAALGLIPATAARSIADAAGDLELDPRALAREAARAGVLGVPLVHALRAEVERRAGAAAPFVHLGSTSQDLMDSAMVLCTRVAVLRIDAQLALAATAARALAVAHREVPVLARTLLQAAGVTSLGYKIAQWHAALRRARSHLAHSAAQALALALGGPLGNLTAYGEHGAALRAHLAAALALRDPGRTWHSDRQDWIALAQAAALACGVLAKIAQDIALMAQNEVAEVSEPAAPGRGQSSALTHKRNPVLCLEVLAATQPVPGFAASLLAGMPQHWHERALGAWQAELALWPQVFQRTHAAARALAELLAGLEVHPGACLRNILAVAASVFPESEGEASQRIARAARDSARHMDGLLD